MTSIVYPSLPAGAASSSEAVGTDLGIQFSITASGCQLAGYYVYIPSGGDTAGADYTFALWSTANGTTGTLISGSSLTGSGTLTGGAWNYFPLGTPVALVSGTTYVTACHFLANVTYEYLHSYWTTGGGGASGITSGPITAPNSATALGGAQEPFNSSTSSITFPATANYMSSWYGIDINVTAAAARPAYIGQGLPQAVVTAATR